MTRARLAVAISGIAVGIAACASPTPSSSAAPSMASASPGISFPVPPTDSPSPLPTVSPMAAAEPAWELLPADGPRAREDHTWTVAGATGVALLFGGRDGQTVFADLWAFDLATETWTALDPPRGPAARFGHEAVWVDDVGIVVFAGQAGSTFFNDLWAFDPDAATWTELPSRGAVPVARYGTCGAIGPDGRLWISHGFTSDGTRFADTRAYDFASGEWTDETPDGELPVNRCLHGCWWTADGAFSLYAGQTTGVTALGDRWRLVEGAWTEESDGLPPDRNLYAHARLADATVVFGGQAADGSFQGDAWLLPDAAGDAVPVQTEGNVPQPRAGAELIVDDERDRLVLFGGRDGDAALADTWALAGLDALDR